MADSGNYDSTVAAGIQTLGNAAITAASNKRQFKYQQQAMDKQLAQNKELWDYQNAYNTPQQQMSRLDAAGLNPYLIYGSGSGNTGLAGPIESPDVPTRRAVNPEIKTDLFMRRLATRQMDAQYQATTAKTEQVKSQTALQDIQQGLKSLELMRQQLRSKNYGDLAQAEVDTAKWVALRSSRLAANEFTKGNLMDQLHQFREHQITGQQLDNAFKNNRNELAKMGIYSSDNIGLRLLIQGANRMGLDIDDLLKQGAEKLMYLVK